MECITENCKNKEFQGKFYGNLCMPCHQYYLAQLEIKNFSQAHRNHIEYCIYNLTECEVYIARKKYKK